MSTSTPWQLRLTDESMRLAFTSLPALTAWHMHPNGQTIYLTEGVGPAQGRGGPITVIRAVMVFFEPGEEHWHGAAPNHFMTHIAMLAIDDQGNAATWGEHVTDEEYGSAPSADSA